MPDSNSAQKKTKKLNAVDIFIIVAIVCCLAGGALRVIVGSDGGSIAAPVTMEDYIVSFKISNIRNSSTEYLGTDEEFYIDSTKQYFGKITDSVSVTPAMFYVEDTEGNYVRTYAPENGDATRVDVSGTLLVSGYMSDNGFLLGGTTAVAIGKTFALRSGYIYVTITVTDLVKAS